MSEFTPTPEKQTAHFLNFFLAGPFDPLDFRLGWECDGGKGYREGRATRAYVYFLVMWRGDLEDS
jgi:hypothetical protein